MSVFEPPILEDFTPNDDSNSSSFLSNLAICSSVFLAGLILYDILRYFDPGHCYYRQAAARYCTDNNYDGTPLQSPERPSNYPFSWVWPTLTYPFEQLIVTHGLDVAMYIRFLQTQARIFFILTIYTAVTLIPIYVTSDFNLIDESIRPKDIEIATLANIPDRSPRLWLTLFSEIVVTAVVLLFLYWDIKDYTARRVSYRSNVVKNPSNFAILIMDIPAKDRCQTRIFELFNNVFPGQVVAVHIVRDASQVLVVKTRLISSLNRQRRICAAQESFDDDVPNRGGEGIQPDPITVFPLTLSFSIDTHALSPDPGGHGAVPIQVQPNIEEEVVEKDDSSSASGFSPGPLGRSISRFRGPSVEFQVLQQEIMIARRLIKEKEEHLDKYAPVSHAAFVIFRSQVTTTCAVTSPVFPMAGTWTICRAPDPRAINWNRICISKYTTRVRKYISFAVLTAMTIIWAVPSFLIQLLGDLDEVGRILSEESNNHSVLNFVEQNPKTADFLMRFAPPVLLFLVLLIAPQLFRFVIRFERIPSQVEAEDKVSDFLFFFFVMSNFIYQVSVKTVLLILGNKKDITGGLLSILSNAVPKKATFLMKYVIVNSFMGSVVGMLNTGRLLIRPIVLWRARTDRDRMMADRIFADYPFAKMYALCLMISLISMVYTTIAPIFNAVAFLYFGLAYICSKQLLLFSHRPMFEGGGYLYRHTWTGVMVGLFAHQVTITAIFSFKKAVYQAVLSFAFLVISLSSFFIWRSRFLSRIEHGSLIVQTEAETDKDGCNMREVPADFIDMYVHPGLKPVDSLMQVSSKSTDSPLFNGSSQT